MENQHQPLEPDAGRGATAHRWSAIVDWLGARKPLDLILGMLVIITLIAASVAALSQG